MLVRRLATAGLVAGVLIGVFLVLLVPAAELAIGRGPYILGKAVEGSWLARATVVSGCRLPADLFPNAYLDVVYFAMTRDVPLSEIEDMLDGLEGCASLDIWKSDEAAEVISFAIYLSRWPYVEILLQRGVEVPAVACASVRSRTPDVQAVDVFANACEGRGL